MTCPMGGNLGKGPMRSKSSMLAIALLVGAGALSIVPTSTSVDAAPAGFTDSQVVTTPPRRSRRPPP